MGEGLGTALVLCASQLQAMEPPQHTEQAAGDGRAVRRRWPRAGQPRSVARRALEARAVRRSVSFDDADLAVRDKLDMCVRPSSAP